MALHIKEEDPSRLAEYASIPISFIVNRVLEVEPLEDGLSGFKFTNQKAAPPYVKDYDQMPNEGPMIWAKRWNISNWGIFAAYLDGERVGGAVVAWNTPNVYWLEGDVGIAALWDIRVHPDHQGNGIGTKLFESACAWAKQKDCRLLKIETQNINVPACRFYMRQGCTLGGINRFAYADLPDEVQMIWYKKLK